MKDEDETINKKDELSDIEKELLKQDEQQMLFEKTESFLPEYIEDKELEIHVLTNGTEFSRRSIKELVQNAAGEYFPMFPNNKPFFKLMYKLNRWVNLNPNNFIKPPVVALWIKLYVYGRFEKWVLDELLAKENPIIRDYIRQYKLFQFLDERGQMLMEGYIQDAIDVMEEVSQRSGNWHDFEKAYCKKYKLAVQLKVFAD